MKPNEYNDDDDDDDDYDDQEQASWIWRIVILLDDRVV